jgi:hypothetical protein
LQCHHKTGAGKYFFRPTKIDFYIIKKAINDKQLIHEFYEENMGIFIPVTAATSTGSTNRHE